MNTVGSHTITINDTSNTGLTVTITRTLASPVFTVLQQSNAKAGPPVYVEVGATDFFFGTTITNYRGTVHFTSSDPSAVLPAPYTFTAADAGTHANFNVTFNTAGNQIITATDTWNPFMTGSVTIAVAPPQVATATSVATNPSSIVF